MADVESLYQQFIQTVRKHNPDADFALLEKAFQFSNESHKGQMRQSGEPYIIHPTLVATNLARLNMDSPAIAAGLLHDVIEDTSTTPDQLEELFGKSVRELVEGVSNLRRIRFSNKSQYIENLRKMFVATAKDIRVIIIRLCDRLHNMQTLEYLTAEQQHRIALETLEIYAPIAHRLQMGQLRGELEDWAFKYLHPEEYRWLYNVTRKNLQDNEVRLNRTSGRIRELLEREQIQVVNIQKRIKFLYSLYKKLQRYDNDLSRIYDVVALRVIVPKVADCYAALGIIHREFKPVKGRIKDYIARPKTNGYTSLHTTVIIEEGHIIEVQIRTPEMHEKAEYGIAAHWLYKDGTNSQRPIEISWVKELARLIQEIRDPNDFESMKIDLFNHRIFVLTPQGDVIDLPEEATPVDFAYHIHTDVGNQTTRAKVNGISQPLDAKLQNGDIVEIITDKKKTGPDIEWLDFVKTHLAISKIKYYNRKRLAKWRDKLQQTKISS